MRIAFTSCCDTVRDSTQRAWDVLAAQQPDLLLLLGDSIYMDYAFDHELDNGEPAKLPLADFGKLMHARYAAQWAVPRFAAALRVMPQVHAIWDDHDFGWNNAHGAGSGEGFMPAPYRHLSTALFLQYRQALQDKPAEYPPQPHADGIAPPAPDAGIALTVEIEAGVRLHLLDGRSFREAPGGSLIGLAQREALEAVMLPPPGINLIASGTTLKDWKRHADISWLRKLGDQHHLLMLSGDIHQHRFKKLDRIHEATASAMAQPPGVTGIFGKESEVFGLLDIEPERLVIGLWQKGLERERLVIDRGSWKAL